MKKAILLGTTGVAVALAMLGFGFVTGSPQPAKADA
ncbi:MAG: DsbA family protein, partial [Mesorhizobium sp.]